MGADKRIATALSQVPVCVGVSIFGALRMLTPVGEPAAPAPALLPLAPKATAEPEGAGDDRVMAALAWFTMVILQLPIVSIIQLLSPTNKERAFQRHHTVTSLLFYATAVVYEIVFGIAYAIIGLVTLTLGYICLWPLFFVPHLLGLYYALQAYNGKRVELPLLSEFGRNQGWLSARVRGQWSGVRGRDRVIDLLMLCVRVVYLINATAKRVHIEGASLFRSSIY